MPQALADSLSTLPDYVCIETSDGAPAFRDESLVGRIKVPGAPAMRKGSKQANRKEQMNQEPDRPERGNGYDIHALPPRILVRMFLYRQTESAGHAQGRFMSTETPHPSQQSQFGLLLMTPRLVVANTDF